MHQSQANVIDTRYDNGLPEYKRKFYYVSEIKNYVGVFLLINLLSVAHFAQNIRCWCFGPSSPAAVAVNVFFFLVTNVCFITLAVKNPGTIAKDLDLPHIPVNQNFSAGQVVITHRNALSVIKECDPCQIWRPARAAHCGTCNHCVTNFDHHCPWVGACIGKNNYKFFFGFVTGLNGHLAATIVCSVFVMVNAQGTFGQRMADYPLVIPITVVACAFQAFALVLLGLHCYLVSG